MNDVWMWSAIALFVGPIVAAMMIPIFKWLLADWRRIVLFALVLLGAYGYYKHVEGAPPASKPGHFRLEKD